MNLVTYVPSRDLMGRFKPSKGKVFKFLFVVAALASFWGNLKLASMVWNIECSEGGYFMSKSKCHELAEVKMDALRYYQAETVRAMNNNQALEEIYD